MPKKKPVDPFPDDGCISYQPRMVIIRSDSHPHCSNPVYTETILITRDLTDMEQARLKQAKTPEEVRDLVDLICEINEPTEYEVNLCQ